MFRKFMSALLALAIIIPPSPSWAQGDLLREVLRNTQQSSKTSTSAEIIGHVVGVSDGDTITVLDADKHQHRIRFLGIDAPEKAQPYGQRAKQGLADLVHSKMVRCTCVGEDRYGRSLCSVFVNAHTDVNLAMVAAGLAWHNKPYEHSQSAKDRAAYALAQRAAQSARIGLWVDPNPIPPWNYRRETRQHGP